ncbi:MAG TPA: pantoate--beta-alanine ligase [Bryobacteraceae bacterium]|nr:pantoate--beta-alanine ligase [Bryobacteraceae bacterium]
MSARLLHKIAEAREHIAAARERGLTIGLVPTMGALHDGHGALMRLAREETGYVVATIFVNPTQFDRPDDFQKYPRNLQADVDFCDRLGVDAVFAPDAEEMYPEEALTYVEVAGISSRLEGEYRPGHFRGVATVVAKLFHIAQADRAYFGEKDAQQLAVIQKMAADLNFPVTIVPVPTVREPNGLAMSSRNQRLTPADRRIAPALYQALCEAERAIQSGSRSVAAVRQGALALLAQSPALRIEYLEVVDPKTFQPVDKLNGAVRIVAAVWLGNVRLIDNLVPEFDKLER